VTTVLRAPRDAVFAYLIDMFAGPSKDQREFNDIEAKFAG
jgi:hypothetical protein